MGSITNLKTDKTLFISCGCKSEILVIDYDWQLDIADFAIYENHMSFKNKMSIWQRLRYVWQVLWHKKPYADQIQLNRTQIDDIKHFFNSL